MNAASTCVSVCVRNNQLSYRCNTPLSFSCNATNAMLCLGCRGHVLHDSPFPLAQLRDVGGTRHSYQDSPITSALSPRKQTAALFRFFPHQLVEYYCNSRLVASSPSRNLSDTPLFFALMCCLAGAVLIGQRVEVWYRVIKHRFHVRREGLTGASSNLAFSRSS